VPASVLSAIPIMEVANATGWIVIAITAFQPAAVPTYSIGDSGHIATNDFDPDNAIRVVSAGATSAVALGA
jgi:hypothetical protein